MARSRSNGGGSTKRSSFGSSSAAPSRPMHTAAAPAPTRTAAPAASSAHPPAVQSAPAPAAAAPHPSAAAGAQAGAGGGLLAGLAGTVMQGMAFGTGSAVANRAVDAVMGPRTVVHEHQTTSSPQAIDSGAMGATAGAGAAADSQVCGTEVSQFQTCMRDNNQNLSSCQFFFDMLSQCQRSSKENARW